MSSSDRPLGGRRAGLLVVVAALLTAAFARPSPHAPTAPPARQDEEDAVPPLPLADWPASAAAARGRVVYEQNCIGCHGPEGLGDGAAAAHLDPLPRNFQTNRFKFRSTESGQLPNDADLFRTITRGLPGSSMPGFPLLSEGKRHDVVAYVLHLAGYGLAKQIARRWMLKDEIGLDVVRTTRLAELQAEVKKQLFDARKTVVVPQETPRTAASAARGKELYLKNCSACHGASGRGDGSSSYALRDWQDAEIRARDFTSGVFRGGDEPRDLFLRLRTGLNGTPMPSSLEPDEDVWAIVQYALDLRKPGVIPHTRRMGLRPGETR